MLVANNDTVLTEDDLALLTQPTKVAEPWIERLFVGTYGSRNARFLDQWIANIPRLENEAKRDVAAWLPVFCSMRRIKYYAARLSKEGIVAGSERLAQSDLAQDMIVSAREILPQLVFNNGHSHQAYNEDAMSLIGRIELDGFRLDDYKAMSSPEEGMKALTKFLADVARVEGHRFESRSDNLFVWKDARTEEEVLLTSDREVSLEKEQVQLLGLDGPLLTRFLEKYRALPPEELGVRVLSTDEKTGVVSFWQVESRSEKGQKKRIIFPLAVDADGKRLLEWERKPESVWVLPAASNDQSTPNLKLLHDWFEPMLQRELAGC